MVLPTLDGWVRQRGHWSMFGIRLFSAYCVEKLPVAVRCHFSVGPPTLTRTPIAAPGSI
ncbi:hypothetical protein THIARS_70010 [Thiomonas delicata]|uniref:Transposase n=1 Tax=Thiomonas delicata TaxID=364030 RepID=A0A238D5E7_THIDL|nr:hypothetical protein THIARS_70010 [Thiomonas delicata]